MLRSKNIDDYFDADLELLKADLPLPCAIHLYFSLSDHLMQWLPREYVPTVLFLEKYQGRGLKKIWIHERDRDAFNAYLKGAQPQEAPAPETNPESAPQLTPEEASRVQKAKEEAARQLDELLELGRKIAAGVDKNKGAEIAALLTDPKKTAQEKKAALASIARDILLDAAAAKTREEQAAADKKARKTIQEMLEAAAMQADTIVGEIWKLADIDPDLEHAVNVATYAVVFALAFGKIESDLIADLALAGLLHDIGFSQVPAHVASTPTQKLHSLSEEEALTYTEHVPAGLSIVQLHAPTVPERVRTMIGQHHEKFDGTGYPSRLSGFQIDDVGVLVGMSDLLDTMKSGQWDGEERTLMESFEKLEALEQGRTFPEFFNPDIYSTVVHCIRGTATEGLTSEASAVVAEEVKEVIGKK